MYLRTGLGIVGGPVTQCDLPIVSWFSGECWSRAWDGLFPQRPVVAPVRAPTGDVLTVPPASGEQASATVQALIDQQMIDQQSLNAAGVESSVLDRASSAAVSTGAALAAPGGVSWLVWGALGLGVFALVAMGGGSPRRYGR